MRSSMTLSVALAAVVALGACGDGDPAGTSTTATATATAASTTTDASTTPAATTPAMDPSTATVTVDESSPEPSTTEAGTPATDAPVSLSIETEAWEWKFKPDAWTVPAGEELTIDFTNRGVGEHDWTVLALGENITKLSEFEDDMVLFQVEKVPSGEAATETLTIDEPGTYQVICSLSGHFNTGMAGVLTVK